MLKGSDATFGTRREYANGGKPEPYDDVRHIVDGDTGYILKVYPDGGCVVVDFERDGIMDVFADNPLSSSRKGAELSMSIEMDELLLRSQNRLPVSLGMLTDYYDHLARLRWHRLILNDDWKTTREHLTLRSIAAVHGGEWQEMYDAFSAYHSSGPAFGTERAPMPQRPSGQLTIV